MSGLELAVLGELELTLDGTPVAVTGPGRRALLARLTVDVGRVVSTGALVADLWGDDPPASALKVIQTYVSQLRRRLEPDREDGWEVLVTHASGYELALPPDAVDARRFEAAVRATAERPDLEVVEPLRAVLSLWRGPAYADIDRPFATLEATRLDRLRLTATTRCLAGELARGRHLQVEPELRALAAARPLDETVAELLMLALYRGGRPAEALQVHTELRHRLADQLGTDPGPSLTRLHERMLRHDLGPSGAPPAAPPAATPGPAPARGNLPPSRSSFVGRAEEIRTVATSVAEHRLTTLVGAGGAGKTRLALEAARRATDRFEGVWLVALGTLDDPTHLAGHCLTELGVLDQMDRPPEDTLRGWIDDRHLLLVLDNCEHLVESVATLVDQLLGACPQLHVLATSRQPLRCPGEHRWRVPTLQLPDAASVAAVAASEAGMLFVSRGQDARPDFTLDASTAPAVHRICRRLDGIPLAIELAAVRMATMSAADLADGLDDRFELLTSGHRTALPRHRTLLATTDWSYELLTVPQQRLLCRLSTFVADADGEAVTDVCGFAPLPPRQVPGLLADLVEHSLVEAHVDTDRTRYRLLETVREYGRARLGDEDDELVRRYGDWAARLAEAVGAHAQHDTTTWYARFDREFLHLQGAFSAAARRGDATTALRIAARPGWAPIIVGRFHRLRQWLREALTLAEGTEVDDAVLAQGLLMAGAVAGIDHRFEGTLALLDEADARFGAAGDVVGRRWTGYWRAATLAEMGSLDEALTEIEATASAAADDGLDVVEANARAEQAELQIAASLARGGPEPAALSAAGTALDRAGALAAEQGMQELTARVGLSAALLDALRGEPVAALPAAQHQLQVWRGLGRGNRLILGMVATAKVALLAGRPDLAVEPVAEALGLIGEFAWTGPLRGAAQVVAALAADHDPAAAAQLLGAADVHAPTHRWRMPIDLTEVEASVSGRLGAAAARELRTVGAHLDLDEVVELALGTVAAAARAPVT